MLGFNIPDDWHSILRWGRVLEHLYVKWLSGLRCIMFSSEEITEFFMERLKQRSKLWRLLEGMLKLGWKAKK